MMHRPSGEPRPREDRNHDWDGRDAVLSGEDSITAVVAVRADEESAMVEIARGVIAHG